MVKHSNIRIRLAEAGENVLIPIPTLDRRSPFDRQNLPGVILEIRDDGGIHRICCCRSIGLNVHAQPVPTVNVQFFCAGGCSRQTGFTSESNTLLIVWETQAAV